MDRSFIFSVTIGVMESMQQTMSPIKIYIQENTNTLTQNVNVTLYFFK